MGRTILKSAMADAMLLGLATAAGTESTTTSAPWNLGTARGKKQNCSVNATIDGKTYCFGNEDAKTTFMKDPQGNFAKGASLLIQTSTSIEPGTRLVYEASALHATGIASNTASRRCRVSRVEVSARPSMRPWRKWR